MGMQSEPSPAVNLAPKVSAGVIASPALRSGWKTTEFWIAIGLISLDVLGAIQGLIPPEHAATLAAITGAIYKVVRSVQKFRQGVVAVEAALAPIGVSQIEEVVLPACPACGSNAQVTLVNHVRGAFFCPCNEPSQGLDRLGAVGGFFDAGPVPVLHGNPIRAGSETGHVDRGFLLALGTAFAVAAVVALLTGCVGSGTRFIESAEGHASATRNDLTKETTQTVGIKLNFRDGRDAKEIIKPLSLRTGVLDGQDLGGPLRIPFRLDIFTIDERTEDVIVAPDGIARIVPNLDRLALTGFTKGGL